MPSVINRWHFFYVDFLIDTKAYFNKISNAFIAYYFTHIYNKQPYILK